MVKVMSLAFVCLAVAALGAHAGGSKKNQEECASDDECSRGHCYLRRKDNKKVCVDCTSSEMGDFRGQNQRYCKDEPRSCDRIPNLDEVSQEFFSIRLANHDRCITAREREMKECWAGGDDEHKAALKDAEDARKVCYDQLNSRKGSGGIYTCSDSTYTSRASAVKETCSSYGRGCDEWSKDDKVVDCGKIEDAQKAVNKCVDAIERIDSDCLPSLSRFREVQFRDAKNAYDSCRAILDYKKDKKLCK